MSAVWPQSHYDRLCELAKGRTLTASQLADEINQEFRTHYSRNSIIGQFTRKKPSGDIGLSSKCGARPARPGDGHPWRQPLAQGRTRSRAPRPAARPPKAVKVEKSHVIETAEIAELSGNNEATEIAPDVFLPAQRVRLMDAEPHQCRWPAADDGSATMVCGADVAHGSYCSTHFWKSRRAPSA